jgi:hypothetical protein
MTRGWRKLHNKGFIMYIFLPGGIRVIKSTKMRSVGHVPHMGDESVYEILTRVP